ncbi:MAG: glycosyltransferase family 2 protein [Gammaproteobacteria bacterium]|nr:glycosyltransferase family 2 protein [Gammaproteobacteria bacterium]
MADDGGLWIVVPAYNEGPVVASVVSELTERYPNVVVVDDCSTDATAVAAEAAGATVLRHPINLGQGAALETGIRYALSRGARNVVTFDADGQHRMEDIATLLDARETSGADVVLGSRFQGGTEGIPRGRRILLKSAVALGRMGRRVRLTDVHNGLRLLSRSAAERIHITQNGMAHASEIIRRIGELDLNVAEVPVTIRYTDYSLRKGQKLASALRIVVDLLVGRLQK